MSQGKPITSAEQLLGRWKLERTEIAGYDLASETLEFSQDRSYKWLIATKQDEPPSGVREHVFELTEAGYQHGKPGEAPFAKLDAWFEENSLAVRPRHGNTSWFVRVKG